MHALLTFLTLVTLAGWIYLAVARAPCWQPRQPPVFLAGTLIGMLVLYLVPVLAFFFAGSPETALLGLTVSGFSAALYLPTAKFYNQSMVWALTLPPAALVYGAATFDSARLYHQGKGGQWKGRAQA